LIAGKTFLDVLSSCHICDLGDISCCALYLGIVRCIAFTSSVEMQIVEVYARNILHISHRIVGKM
jgi:hypothetical protein